MAEEEVLPVVRFSLAPGIWVDRTENPVTITGNMELYGDEADEGGYEDGEEDLQVGWLRCWCRHGGGLWIGGIFGVDATECAR